MTADLLEAIAALFAATVLAHAWISIRFSRRRLDLVCALYRELAEAFDRHLEAEVQDAAKRYHTSTRRAQA